MAVLITALDASRCGYAYGHEFLGKIAGNHRCEPTAAVL
jgi:hypothetical protein